MKQNKNNRHRYSVSSYFSCLARILCFCLLLNIAGSTLAAPPIQAVAAAGNTSSSSTGDSWQELRFQRKNFYMYVGTTIALQPMLTSAFDCYNIAVSCTSSDSTIVKITKSGKLTGVAPGKATITCTYTSNGKKQKCTMVMNVKKSTGATKASEFEYSKNGITLQITGMNKESKKVVIPAYIDGYPVTSIGSYAFAESTIQNVTIPGTVTTINYAAFYSSKSLSTVKGGAKVETIGDYAFYCCEALTKVGNFPKLTNIGNNAFSRTGLSDKDNPAYFTSENWNSAHMGDLIHFGTYEQDGNPENGAEDIIWSVITVEEDYLLLQSDSVLDAKAFAVDAEKGESWATSTLREWLNQTLYPAAFTSSEQKKIALTLVNTWNTNAYSFLPYNSRYTEDTQDYITLPAFLCSNYWNSIEYLDEERTHFTANIAIWVAKSGDAGEKHYYTDESIFKTSNSQTGKVITGIKDTSVEKLYIPPTIGGKKVVKIAANAFDGCDKLTTIKLPENITTISENAFKQCPVLENIYFPSTLKRLTSSTLKETMTTISYSTDISESIEVEILRYQNRDIWQVIESNTSRWGLWDLTYKEFIEIYQSIGTENDMFIEMLKEKGPRHTDDGSYFEFDGIANLDIQFESVTAEKLYALHYAPFEYNYDDYISGQYGKNCLEAYEDHGGVCGILTDTYYHFIREILGELSWTYSPYGNDEVNHATLLIKTEDGKVFQIDNCGADYWWLGINFFPNTEIASISPDPNVAQTFKQWKQEFLTLDEVSWYTFTLYKDYDWSRNEWIQRPIWLNYETNEFETYLATDMPKAYNVVCTGLPGKVISMAGHTNLDGYVSLDALVFE